MTINSKKYAKLLVQWYNKNKRELPWRLSQDPYRIWISEIMLQQTQVNTVIPYYLRFLTSFSTVESLSHADEASLLKCWEGLGYYNRVRHMKIAAQHIMSEYHGVFPSQYDELLKLKGIGEYTAGAIASIAYNQKIPAVDGNVMRVISRLIEYPKDIKLEKSRKEVKRYIQAFYETQKASDLTQAFMELGALICTFKNPQCSKCPWSSVCLAKKHQSQNSFPIVLNKIKKMVELKTVIVLMCGLKFGLIKRKQEEVLSGFYEWYNQEGHLSSEALLKQLRIEPLQIKPLPQRKHVVAHKTWVLQVYIVTCAKQDSRFTWFSSEEIISDIALPAAFKKMFEEALCEKNRIIN